MTQADTTANADQMRSPAFRLPALDQDFLLGESTRGLRFQLEYQKAHDALARFGVRSTLVVFGSARVREDGPAKHARWYAEARAFGRIASAEGGATRPVDGAYHNVIVTGGGPGIMEAANRGAFEAGAPTVGFNITLPHEQEPNPYTTAELTFRFHYFAMRKMHLAMGARGLVVFPGGFGTFDEAFELLTLVQTGKAGPLPIVFVDADYWRGVVNFDRLVDEGFVSRRDVDLITFVETGRDAWRAISSTQAGVP